MEFGRRVDRQRSRESARNVFAREADILEEMLIQLFQRCQGFALPPSANAGREFV